MRTLFSLWKWRQQGFLPDAGGLLDQSKYYITAMEAFDEAFGDAEDASS